MMRRRRASTQQGSESSAFQFDFGVTEPVAIHFELPAAGSDEGRVGSCCRAGRIVQHSQSLVDPAAFAKHLRTEQTFRNREMPDLREPRSQPPPRQAGRR